MSIDAGRASLNQALRDLLAAWQTARLQWEDTTRQRFDDNCMAPLEKDVRITLGAMEGMAQLLQRARNDCQ